MVKILNKLVAFIFICLFLFVGCVVYIGFDSQKKTEKIIDVYYQQYNNKKFQYIYDNLFDYQAKISSSPDQIAQLYYRFGKYKSRSLQSFKFLNTPGKLYYFRYSTVYENKSSIDSFIIKDQGENRIEIEKYPGSVKWE